MAKHKHAALMQQYAQDWAETEQPWKRWEVTSHRNEWVPLCGHPYWNEESEYRRKPRTMTYTVTILEPLREVPKDGEVCYVAAPDAEGFCLEIAWYECAMYIQWFKRGLCFATKEDAIATAKAMLPIKGE
jgi:hypothetical protein